MDWTAEQVHELVKDWPHEAKPMYVTYWNATGTPCFVHDGKIESSLAAHAFVGSGLAWLAMNHKQGVLWPLSTEGPWCCEFQRLPRVGAAGPTPLHAVSAAVRTAKEKGNG